jgi:hypothetical protein
VKSHDVRKLTTCSDCEHLAIKDDAFLFEGSYLHPECFVARYDSKRVYWFLNQLPASELGKLTVGQSRAAKLDGRQVMEMYNRKLKEETMDINVRSQRPLHAIAQEISSDWGAKVNYAAKPYLEAMACLDRITDNYGEDSARSIVNYFLANARTWRGDVAKRVKAELKALVESRSL